MTYFLGDISNGYDLFSAIFFEKCFGMKNHVYNIFGRFSAENMKFRPNFVSKIFFRGRKIENFRFFKNRSKTFGNGNMSFKSGLGTPKHHFWAIYHRFGHYVSIYQKLIFLNFGIFINISNVWVFSWIVVFVAFVAFWGTTTKFFEKYEFRAFRKVYGYWSYFQPERSYSNFKFNNKTAQSPFRTL